MSIRNSDLFKFEVLNLDTFLKGYHKYQKIKKNKFKFSNNFKYLSKNCLESTQLKTSTVYSEDARTGVGNLHLF